MPADNLPDHFIVGTRASEVANYKRDYQVRNPGVDVTAGSLPDIDAQVMADMTAPLYYDASLVGNAAALDNMSRAQLLVELNNLTGAGFLPAQPSTGQVYCSCSAGGTNIPYGQQLTNLITGVRYICTAAGLYQNGQPIPVASQDTGPSTNILATTPPTSLKWVSAPTGANPLAAVVPQANGTGLSGGSNVEMNAQAVARLRAVRTNPPASGNDASYQALVLVTPGVPVQAVFTYPAILGPGTEGICFTVLPTSPGGNRIPNATQIQRVAQWLSGQEPANDVPLLCTLVSSPVVICFKVSWAQNAPAWADAAPWPAYAAPIATQGVTVVATTGGALTSTSFGLRAVAAQATPQVGQSIAVLDQTQPNGPVFQRKKILTVTVDAGIGGWDITVDNTQGLSDTSYTPVSGQQVCPWSDSLSTLIKPTIAYTDTLGPGEQIATFFDPGLRKKRSPPSPGSWPSSLTNRILGVGAQTTVTPAQGQPPLVTLFTLASVADILLTDPVPPYVTPVGVAGVTSNILTVGNLLAFPE